MKKLLFCSLFISQTVLAGSDLAQFSPSGQRIRGEQYPRNGRLLFRGMEQHQFELDKALKSMLGDKSSMIESRLFTSIKYELLGQSFSHAVGIDRQIGHQTYRNSFSEDVEATEKTKELLDQYFNSLSRSEHIAKNIDYRSGSYNDWPSDIVFSSIIQPAAGTYGYNMAMIRETSPRSIDLNYYNYVNNNAWYDHTRDVGEFAAYGYIPSEDIVGFQVRETAGSKGWHRIRYAFQKDESAQLEQVKVFDGAHPYYKTPSSCMSFNNQDEMYHCNYRPGTIQMTVPRLSRYKAIQIGLIILCGQTESDSDCKQRYGVESVSFNGRIDRDIQAKIDAAEFSDKRALLID